MFKVIPIIFAIIIVATFFMFVTIIQTYKQTKIDSLTHCSTVKTEYSCIKTPNSNHHIVLLGDSRIKDWGKPHFGNDITVTNIGLAGATTYQTLCRLDEIISLNPDLLILQIGINDIVAIKLLSVDLRMKGQTESCLNLKKIITKLFASKTNTLILTIVPPIAPGFVRKFVWGDNLEATVVYFNQILQTHQSEKITLFNMRDVFFNSTTQNWRKEYSRDALHWNENAYNSLTKSITQQLLTQPSLLR